MVRTAYKNFKVLSYRRPSATSWFGPSMHRDDDGGSELDLYEFSDIYQRLYHVFRRSMVNLYSRFLMVPKIIHSVLYIIFNPLIQIVKRKNDYRKVVSNTLTIQAQKIM